MKEVIRLTESDLHKIVKESVNNILAENEIEEGMFGGLNNVWQGMKSGNFNVGQTYRAGNISSNFQKYAQQAMLAIQQLSNIAKQTNNKQIVQYLNNVYSALEKTIPMFQKTAQNIAQGNGQQGTAKDFSISQKNMQRLGYNNMLNKNQMKQYNQMVANDNSAQTPNQTSNVSVAKGNNVK